MTENHIEGVRVFKGTTFTDCRGKFSRVFDSDWFSEDSFKLSQTNFSVNPIKGTLRGMHFQKSGQPENKLMTLMQGAVFLVIVDLRRSASTYLNMDLQNISAEEGVTFFIPAGCATGWLSLTPDVQIHYMMSSRFEENLYSGFKYDDPFFNIPWPNSPEVISEQDSKWPPFRASS